MTSQITVLINLDNEGSPRGVLIQEEPEYLTFHKASYGEVLNVRNLLDEVLYADTSNLGRIGTVSSNQSTVTNVT